MVDSATYWAALPSDQLGKRAIDKVRAYRRWFYNTGYAQKALKGWRMANGWDDAGATSSKLQLGGERNQLIKAVVNGVRPLRQRTVAMVLSGAPEMQPIAANSDAAAREQADLSRGVLEHIHRVHKRAKKDRIALNLAMDMGEAALVIEWDSNKGRPIGVDPEANRPVLEGDFAYWVASAFDVYRDVGLRDWEDATWVVCRRWVSRYRLMALYPEHAERILSVAPETVTADEYDFFTVRLTQDTTVETDMVAEYVLWHKDCAELPGGREVRFIADGTVLSDGEYPYEGEGLPAIRLTPDEIACTSIGYTNIFDALGLSDAINGIVSSMETNVIKGAVPPILNPKSSGLSKGIQLGSGHQVWDVTDKDSAPFYMESPTTPPEAYKLLEVLERLRMEALGLNETSMGRPPFSGMAAQAMALLDAKADEYQDALRSGFRDYLAEAATFELKTLKRYAKSERVAQVAGKAKQWMAKSYTADSLSQVDGVHVEPVNQASRTMAGKLGMLDMLKNFEVPLSAEQVIEFFQTGQYESDFEAPLANRLRIREENELLMQGQQPPIITARTHWLDIPEHLALLNSPAVVERPEVVNAVLSTVEAKLEAWRTMPPDLLALLGGPLPPPPPEMMGAPGAVPPVPDGSGNAPQDGQVPQDAAEGAVQALSPDAQEAEMPQPPMAA
jgi:hypothetical protein